MAAILLIVSTILVHITADEPRTTTIAANLIAFHLGFYSIAIISKNHGARSIQSSFDKLVKVEYNMAILAKKLLIKVRSLISLMFAVLFARPLIYQPFTIFTIGFLFASLTCVAISMILLGDTLGSQRVRELGNKAYEKIDFGLFNFTVTAIKIACRTAVKMLGGAKKYLSLLVKGMYITFAGYWDYVLVPSYRLTIKSFKFLWDHPVASSSVTFGLIYCYYIVRFLCLDTYSTRSNLI